MKWLLLLTILSRYSGSSTATANFDSKEICEAARLSHGAISPVSRKRIAVLHADRLVEELNAWLESRSKQLSGEHDVVFHRKISAKTERTPCQTRPRSKSRQSYAT